MAARPRSFLASPLDGPRRLRILGVVSGPSLVHLRRTPARCPHPPAAMPPQPAAPGFDVFLSHDSNDGAAVRALRDRLRARRLAVWCEEDELRPGLPRPRLLAAGIRRSASVAVVVGRGSAGPWEDEAMRAALQLAVENTKRGHPVVPVLLPGAERPDLPKFLRRRRWVDLTEAPDAEQTLDLLVQRLTGRRKAARDHACPPLPDPPPDNRITFAASAPPPPLALDAVLPGTWQIRIRTPFALDTLQVVLTGQHSFRGEWITPSGPSLIEGEWLAHSAPAQITLQGRQATGLQVRPYRMGVRVTFFDSRQIVGATAAGEQVTWHKQTPAA